MYKKIYIFLFLIFSVLSYSFCDVAIKKENVKIVKGLKEGDYTIEYIDGSIESGTYKKGKKTGEYSCDKSEENESEGIRVWQLETGTYNNGVKNGEYVLSYGIDFLDSNTENDNYSNEVGMYVNGFKDGDYVAMFKSGDSEVIELGRYVKSKKEGDYLIEYYNKGVKNSYEEGKYKDNIKVGEYTRYLQDGSVEKQKHK